MSGILARDVEALIEVFESSDWQELRVVTGGFTIELSKRTGVRRITEAARASLTTPRLSESPSQDRVDVAVERHGAGAASPMHDDIPPGCLAVRAPTMGTFYRAARPGARPFVDIGSLVEPETELCLIEVMKLFTAVCAGARGQVREVCLADGATVAKGQLLFVIDPRP